MHWNDIWRTKSCIILRYSHSICHKIVDNMSTEEAQMLLTHCVVLVWIISDCITSGQQQEWKGTGLSSKLLRQDEYEVMQAAVLLIIGFDVSFLAGILSQPWILPAYFLFCTKKLYFYLCLSVMHALQSVGCVDLCIILMTEALHDFGLDSSVLLDFLYTSFFFRAFLHTP